MLVDLVLWPNYDSKNIYKNEFDFLLTLITTSQLSHWWNGLEYKNLISQERNTIFPWNKKLLNCGSTTFFYIFQWRWPLTDTSDRLLSRVNLYLRAILEKGRIYSCFDCEIFNERDHQHWFDRPFTRKVQNNYYYCTIITTTPSMTLWKSKCTVNAIDHINVTWERQREFTANKPYQW